MILEGSVAQDLSLVQKANCTPHIYKYPVPQEKDDSRVMDTQPIIEWQKIKFINNIKKDNNNNNNVDDNDDDNNSNNYDNSCLLAQEAHCSYLSSRPQ